MLFRKKIIKSCSYCLNGTALGEEYILCTKKGVVSALKACHKFEYDPCKRVPPRSKALNFQKYKTEDFSL